jgi:hypothetical protein
MALPPEFDPVNVAACSAPERQMYREEKAALVEPMRSFLENNPGVLRGAQARE